MLKIGVFGVGHLGKIHVGLLQQLSELFEITGYYDPSDNAAAHASLSGLKRFSSQTELIDAVDCVDIVAPTGSHFQIAAEAIKKSRHVFIEKPVSSTTDEARTLMHLAEEASVQVQIGHVERFNPAFISALPYIDRPMFIETHRLAQYNPRGTDVSVVLDLMIHDIDIVLSVVKSNIKRVAANGVSVVSDNPDIANARIEFDNGCVANLTASRISQNNMRKTRMFQRNAYIAIDLLKKDVEIIHQNETHHTDKYQKLDLGVDGVPKPFYIERPPVLSTNAIEQELRAFARCIQTGTPPDVSIEDGFRSMELAVQIMDKLKTAAPGTFETI